MSEGHHKYGPSSAERLVNCPGSVRMQSGIEEVESDFAAEGTDLHQVVADTISGVDVSERMAALSLEQRGAADMCVQFARQLIDNNSFEVHVEVKIDIRDGFMLLTSGTADLVIIYPDKTAVLVDWKFGRKQVAAVNENYQFALYSAGVAQKWGARSVTAHVLQPRINYHDMHTFTNFDAITARYAAAIKRAEGDDLILNATRSGCRYCRAIGTCPAAAAKSDELGDAVALVEEYGITPGNAAALFDLCELASNRVKAIKSELMQQALGGVELPGLRLLERQGSRKITNVAHVYAIMQQLGVSHRDLLDSMSLPIGKAEKLFVDATRKRVECTIKSAKESFTDHCDSAITRGNPSRSLERID